MASKATSTRVIGAPAWIAPDQESRISSKISRGTLRGPAVVGKKGSSPATRRSFHGLPMHLMAGPSEAYSAGKPGG